VSNPGAESRVESLDFRRKLLLAWSLLRNRWMSSCENIYQKMAPGLDSGTLVQLRHEPLPPATAAPAAQIGRDLAHELNNILTIIQGYADRMMLKHGEDPGLRQELQLICENARRAVTVIKRAVPRPPATG
jgi:signal transduction histidine kinase